jgi:hypothetical protein
MSKDTKKSELNSVQQGLKDIAEKYSEYACVIIVDPVLAKIAGGYTAAVFLARLIYWHSRGLLADNWVAKTKREWLNELDIESKSIERYTERFESMGILETKLKKWSGAPTVHYRLNVEKLDALYEEQCKERLLRLRQNVENGIRQSV